MIANQPIKIELNVRKKVLWPLGIVIFVSFLIFILVSNYFMDIGMARLQETHIQNLTHRYHNYMLERTGLMRSILQQLGRDQTIVKALDRRDRQALLQHSTPLFNELLSEQQITHFYYHTPDGTNLLRVHKPDRHSDLINRVTLHTAQRTNTIADGIELGPLGTFTLRVVMPVHVRSRLVGYLELGEDIGPIIDHVSAESDDKIAVLISKKLLDKGAWIEGRQLLDEPANWDLLPEHVVGGIDNPDLIKALPQLSTPEAINNSSDIETVLAERIHRGRFLNMMDVGGRSVGSLLVLQDIHSSLQDHHTSTLLITTFSCLLAITLFWIASNILGQADKNLRMISALLPEETSAGKNRPSTLRLKQDSDTSLKNP